MTRTDAGVQVTIACVSPRCAGVQFRLDEPPRIVQGERTGAIMLEMVTSCPTCGQRVHVVVTPIPPDGFKAANPSAKVVPPGGGSS